MVELYDRSDISADRLFTMSASSSMGRRRRIQQKTPSEEQLSISKQSLPTDVHADQCNRSPSPSFFPTTSSIPELEKKICSKIPKMSSWAWHSIPFHSLPDWLKDNEFLLHNHRPPMYSFRGCVKSIFRLHTETFNIWTHLLGALFFIMLVAGVYIFGDYITFLFEDIQIHNLPLQEQATLLCFFGGAVLCLACSAIYHTFSNHSKGVHGILSRLDYTGISFLITGGSVPTYYYGFYCTTYAKYAYIVISLCLGTLCVCISMWKKFATPKFRTLRFAVFVLLGLYAVIPFVHIFVRDGYIVSTNAYSLWGFVLMGTVNIFGASLYVMRIPERFFPGKFDIWASSHQLFHVCVVMAALVHYNSLLTMITYRLNVGSCVESLNSI